MTDLDEDAPPALSKLASQVAALTSKNNGTSQTLQEVTATATVTPKYSVTTKPAPLKSGFFDKQSTKTRQKASQHSKGPGGSATPHIKARQGPAIPSMFLIPPDEQEKQYAAMRKKMTEDLMPTNDTIKQIAGNQSLLAGFDDQEVMRAVEDVAKNPANIQKYRNNRKVQAFYQQMGSVMAQRCDELGTSQGQQGSSQQPASRRAPKTAVPLQTHASSKQKQSCKIEEVT